MEYLLWLFFTVWFASNTIGLASEEWVQVPMIGHRPDGASERQVAESPRIDNPKVPLNTTKVPITSTKPPFRPSKAPTSSIKVLPWSTTTPSTTTLLPSRKSDAPENLGLPELRIDPGLPVDEFMKAHETLSRYGKGSLVEKVNFLGHLKKQLLEKTAELMPRAIVALSGRSLATSAEGRGHKGIGFPSSEGTLMSLCFLVFAVFLVKIVMQLIQGLQNNSLGVMTSATRTARSTWDKTHTDEELLRLLESLQHRNHAWTQP